MSITRKRRLSVATAASLMLLGGVLLAHETRVVGGYTFVLGFRNEPAFVDEPNAVDLILTRHADGRPIIRGNGDVVDLQIEVQLRHSQTFDSRIIKSAILTDPLEQSFSQPNRYNSWFKPTRRGTYAFHRSDFVCESPLPPATHGFHCVEAPQTFPDHRDR